MLRKVCGCVFCFQSNNATTKQTHTHTRYTKQKQTYYPTHLRVYDIWLVRCERVVSHMSLNTFEWVDVLRVLGTSVANKWCDLMGYTEWKWRGNWCVYKLKESARRRDEVVESSALNVRYYLCITRISRINAKSI